MAQRLLVSVGVAMTVMALFSYHVSAQTSGCMTTIISLSPCLNYISGNSSTPSSSCCSTLSSVVKNEPQCLCVLLNGGTSSLGVAINTTKALELPPACKVQTPPASLCKTVGAPTAAPSESTTPSTGTTPSVPSSSNDGSKATPSTTGDSSDAMSNKSAMFSIVFLAISALASMIKYI